MPSLQSHGNSTASQNTKAPAEAEASVSVTASKILLGVLPGRRQLALAELLATTRLVETDFLTLDFTRIAGNQTRLLERRLGRFVIVDQSAGNAVTHCAGLTAFATAMHIDMEVERLEMAGEHQRLTHDHAAGFTGEILVDRLAIDDDVARTFFQEDTSNRSFAAAGAIVPITDHDLSLDFQRLGLLSGVRMLGAGINLELLGHGVTQRTLGQHALDRFLQRASGKTLLHFLEVGLGDSAGVARVAVVALVLRLVSGYDDIRCVDDDDVIASVNVRREFRLVFSAQTACDFAGHTTQDFALGVNHVPVTLDFMRLGHKGLHDGS